MKKNLVIITVITLIIAIGVIAFQTLSNDNEEEIVDESRVLGNMTSSVPDLSGKTAEEINEIIDQKYSDIINNKTDYVPAPREWQTSGPFQIDRPEYILGEKIFFRADKIPFNENGEIVFYRPINSTHAVVWEKFPFDGSLKSSFNVYFEPKLSEFRKICDKNGLIGEWMIKFTNVNYPQINFSLSNMILPGDEDKFNKIVC